MNVAVPSLLLPAQRRGTGRFELQIETAAAMDKSAIAAVNQIAAVLIRAAAHGAFPAPGLAPASAQLAIGHSRMNGDRVLVYDLEGHGYDVYGFELFRGMAERLIRDGIRVRSIRLSSPVDVIDMLSKLEPNDATEYDAYPPRSPLLRFEVVREPMVESRSRRCLVELTSRVEKSHVQRLTEWLLPWFQLLEAGAYAFPVGLPSEVTSVSGSVALFDEQAIEVSVDRFQASECAWAALLNMIDACWSDTRVVSQVLIE